MEFENIKNVIAEKDIRFIRVETEDINGISKGLTLHVNHFLKTTESKGIPYNVQLHKATASDEGIDSSGIESHGDAFMYIDMKTFQVLPWLKHTAGLLVDAKLLDNRDNILGVSSRAVCKQVLQSLKEREGLEIFGAFEFEFHVLDRVKRTPAFEDVSVYTPFTYPKVNDLLQDIIYNMEKIAIIPERYIVESGNSQFEITFNPEYGIKCADTAFRFRHLVKELALKHDLLATFSSKPFPNYSGSSGHFNQSLWSCAEKNVFVNPESGCNDISKLLEYWIAGLQHHSQALMAFAAPLPNCYSRFAAKSKVVSCERNWGIDKRSCTYRVKNHQTLNTYLEDRRPGAPVNPYLYLAATVIAGMDGISRKLSLISNEEDFHLPQTLEESLKYLKKDDIIVKGLGEKLIYCFIAVKEKEMENPEKMGTSFRYINI